MEKTLMLGKIEGNDRISWLHNITNLMDMNLSKRWEIMEDKGTWCVTNSPWGHKETDMT